MALNIFLELLHTQRTHSSYEESDPWFAEYHVTTLYVAQILYGPRYIVVFTQGCHLFHCLYRSKQTTASHPVIF